MRLHHLSVLHLCACLAVSSVGPILPAGLEAQERTRGYVVVERGQIVDFDSAVFADSATARLVSIARVRHETQSLQINGYRAKVFTRMEGRAGTSRFARGLNLFTYETAAQLQWHQPGAVKVQVLGARSAAPRIPGVRREGWATWWAEILSDHLWFSPAALGDYIQFMGIPDEEALHPLAHDGGELYEYAITDSIQLSLPGRTVRVVAVRVEPVENWRALSDELITSSQRVRYTEGFETDSVQTALSRGIDSIIRDATSNAPVNSRALERDLQSYIRANRGERVVLRQRDERRRYLPTLISGEMWLDADSLDVVRMMGTFVGDRIWDDDPDSPEMMTLEADLEYGLHDNRIWLPHRQVLAATFRYKYLPGAVLPTTAVTTFTDFEIDADTALTFATTLPPGVSGRRYGGWRCPEPWEWESRDDDDCANDAYVKAGVEDDGTEWEIAMPPLNTALAFDFGVPFEHNVDLASDRFIEERLDELARFSEDMRQQLDNARAVAIDWAAALEAFKFNRVQGASLGLGYAWQPGPAFTTVLIGGRFSFGDERVMGSLRWRRDAPLEQWQLGAYRAMQDVEPWTRGLSVGNSMKALFAGHDDADYYLTLGGSFEYERRAGALRDTRIEVRFERQRTVDRVAGSFVNDVFFGTGDFQANPAITEGDFVGLSASKIFSIGSSALTAGLDGLGSRYAQGGRLWSTLTVPFTLGDVLGTVRAKGGRAFGDVLPQLQFRVGGPATVRGFTYGSRRGDAFWATQLDLEFQVSQWWSPVLFADVGDTIEPGAPLVGSGIGVSALSGWIRLDLSKGLRPSTDVRVDLLFRVPVN